MEKISAVYQIVNTVTGDRYVGSSKDIKKRWTAHRSPSAWKYQPNKQLYKDMQKYGLNKFRFQILAPVMPECLKQVEQEFIDMLNPTYNERRSKDHDNKEAARKYFKTDKGKEALKKYQNQICSYNGKLVKLSILASRFYRAGIKHPTLEAKKYLLHE